MKLPRSLGARLTLWHALVLGIVLIGFTLTVYSLLARNLANEIDRSLTDRARQVNSFIRPAPGPFGGGGRVQIPRPDSFASADTFVQVATLQGDVVGASENLQNVTLPITQDVLTKTRAGQISFLDTALGDENVRLLNTPASIDGRPIGLIQVARSTNSVDVALRQLRNLAILGVFIALIFSSIVVWLATRASLRPLDNVIATAGTIGSSADLGRRVSASTSADEVGRLSATFNQMMDRLETSSRELQSAYERVENALGAQRRFVADASHELRTPLTTIRSNATLLSQYPNVTPEDRTAALAQISQEAERMSRLVQELLTLARADAGQALKKEPTFLKPMIEDAVVQARNLSQGVHTFVTEISDTKELLADQDSMRQLALILLDNAIKYTPVNGRITVRLESRDRHAILTVADTGIGISSEDLPHIFERFFRADRSRKAGGTGLGLSIAKWIVDQHGGTINVDSTLGRGTTFTVKLPEIS